MSKPTALAARVLFLLSAPLAVCFAQEEVPDTPDTPDTASRRTAAERFVAARLPFWQERLNLAEWRISVVMTRRADLRSGTLGGIRWDKSRKTAAMAVLHPADYNLASEDMLKDIEFTLVHELIHLELASLPRSEASRKTEEQAVNNLTRALLAAARTP